MKSISNRKPTAVSLFSGCGGSDSGLVDAGFEVLFANDICPYARDFYRSNLPETDYVLADVSTVVSFPNADLLVGCYPCQGFSEGGTRLPQRRVNFLYREFDRALRLIRPRAFIVENVPGLARSNFKHLLKNQMVRFRLAGYRVVKALLNSAHYGVAQERRRIFIVGIRSDIDRDFVFPAPTCGPEAQRPFTTIRDALAGLPAWPEGEFWNEPFHWYYMSRNRRRDWSELSKTIVSNPRHMPLHPMSPPLRRAGPDCWQWTTDEPRRRFSYREAAALQGFPSTVNFPETTGLRLKYRVVGNAVPPQMFRAVAQALPDMW